jgi:hypothetical protein
MNIDETLNSKKSGLWYANRLVVPFQCHFFKVIVDDDIITDFSSRSKDIEITEEGEFTNLYFKQYPELNKAVSKYEAIKIIAVNKGEDVFNFENHKKISLYIQEKHKVLIEANEDDILFIE